MKFGHSVMLRETPFPFSETQLKK